MRTAMLRKSELVTEDPEPKVRLRRVLENGRGVWMASVDGIGDLLTRPSLLAARRDAVARVRANYRLVLGEWLPVRNWF